MGLSKKNLDKLNKFIKNKNFINNENNIYNKNTEIKYQNSSSLKEPGEIFYSLIDNLDDLNDTSKVNDLLRKTEDELFNKNSTKINDSNPLSIEDELYDEFNYLLDE
tara:strand:+ start:932 stop:1252 length:321 start_codon:yes stop_codon:yes gene_type:complete